VTTEQRHSQIRNAKREHTEILSELSEIGKSNFEEQMYQNECPQTNVTHQVVLCGPQKPKSLLKYVDDVLLSGLTINHIFHNSFQLCYVLFKITFINVLFEMLHLSHMFLTAPCSWLLYSLYFVHTVSQTLVPYLICNIVSSYFTCEVEPFVARLFCCCATHASDFPC